MRIAIVTGSAGLIGSQACDFFSSKGYKVVGIDNDMRSYFFGPSSSTKDSLISIKSKIKDYEHYEIDIRDYNKINDVFRKYSKKIDVVIHTAAQPSHDWAAKEPMTDFSINATGTMNLLESTRLNCLDATFIFTSTNKVYGDTPNSLYINEKDSRWEIDMSRYEDHQLYSNGIGNDGSINENMSIDHTKHSIFGASKVAADVMVQEYGRYFGMKTVVFRGGCLTGPNHAGAELHGFLSYLVKCIVNDKPYTIFGYKGKQVRDNIHSLDLVNMFWHFHQNPRPGEIYNAGGGRENSTSILEAIDAINLINGTKWSNYTVDNNNRIGDHIWYITDLSKFKSHYPQWDISINLKETIRQMVYWERERL